MTAFNAVGTSSPSNTVTARTKGDAPLVPSSPVVSPNSTHAAVHLSGWLERGCAIRSFAVEYRTDGEVYWTSVSCDVQNLPDVFKSDLQPLTDYQLRISAPKRASGRFRPS